MDARLILLMPLAAGYGFDLWLGDPRWLPHPIVGFGRAISDDAYQAAVYDCAIVPEFQGKGIGKILMNNLLSQISNCNVILYAAPGKEGFYQTHGFRKLKTGMALFKKSDLMNKHGITE